ncbi:hypothetical protein ACFX15_034784 [Malus domestica]
MRKIVENLSQRSNTINLCDVYEDENGVHLWRNVLEKCLAGRDSFLAPFSPSRSLSKISCQNRVGSAGLLYSGLCIFRGLNLQALHFSSSAAQVMGNYSHMMLKLMQNRVAEYVEAIKGMTCIIGKGSVGVDEAHRGNNEMAGSTLVAERRKTQTAHEAKVSLGEPRELTWRSLLVVLSCGSSGASDFEEVHLPWQNKRKGFFLSLLAFFFGPQRTFVRALHAPASKPASHLHSGHHEQNRRRTSVTTVKRLAGHEARRFALPQARHFGRHDQSRRRTSTTTVKRLAGREARRFALPLILTLALLPSSSFPANSPAHHQNLYKKKGLGFSRLGCQVVLTPELQGMVVAVP